MDELAMVLPGDVTDPSWGGVRCKKCGRPMGGDQTYEGWATCNDVPQACTAFEDIPRPIIDKFYLDLVWSNALRMLGLADAIKWMAERAETDLPGPLELCQRGEGDKALDMQHELWPVLVKEIHMMRGLRVA